MRMSLIGAGFEVLYPVATVVGVSLLEQVLRLDFEFPEPQGISSSFHASRCALLCATMGVSRPSVFPGVVYCVLLCLPAMADPSLSGTVSSGQLILL